MMNIELSIQRGFPDELRHSAAEIYDVAFGEKLSIAIPDKSLRIAILEQGMGSSFSFAAVSENHLAGIAGFKSANGSFTGGITFRLLKENLGFFPALRAVIVLSLSKRKFVSGQLLMDGIAVSTHMRGGGIGTKLLTSLIEFAHNEGYRSIRLDVIDTNPAARRLYERVGFKPVRTARFVYLKWLLGFKAVTQMQYELKA